MVVYFLTAFSVFLLTYLAQSNDYCSEKLTNNGVVNHSSHTKRLIFLACVVLVCVAGLRYYVGTDYGGYYHDYLRYANELWERIKTFDEPGYSFLAEITRRVGADGGLTIFLASAVTISVSVFTIYKNTDETHYALLLYIFMGCWDSSFNAIRQTLAASFLFASIGYLRDKKFGRFLLLLLLAFLCHRSAIVMVVIYFLAHRKVSIGNFFIMVVGVIVLLASTNFLFSVAENVLDKSYNMSYGYLTTSVNLFRVYVGVAPAVFFGIISKQSERNKTDDFYLNLLLIHAVFNVITVGSAYLARMVIYTTPFAVISI